MSQNKYLENIILNSPLVRPTDATTLFGDEAVYLTNTTELSVLMKELGIYQSTSIARRAGRYGSIPDGWTVYKASKTRTIWIWNPTE